MGAAALQSKVEGFLPARESVGRAGMARPLRVPERGKELVQDQGKRHMEGEDQGESQVNVGVSQCGGDFAALQ
jgi:hypothetical protein